MIDMSVISNEEFMMSPGSISHRINHHQQTQHILLGRIKFHEDRKINVASRVLTRKNAPPPGSHVFQQTGIIFELIQDIIGMHLLTKLHDDRTVNVASRVNIIIFKLIQDIIETNLLTKFHEEWTINVASREKCPAPGGHVFKATETIFELIQDIIGTNLLTKFNDDRKMNVTSKVLTRKIAPPLWWPCFSTNRHHFKLVQDIIGMNLLTKKNSPPLGGHLIQVSVTIFELVQGIIKTNLLTIFHQDWTINLASRVLTRKNAPPPGGHVFQPTGIISNHWTINVASRMKNAPPFGSNVFQAKVTIFELIKDISGTNLLSKFHADRKIDVASRVLTRFYFSHIKKCPAPWRPYESSDQFHKEQTINVASRVLTRFYYSHIRKNAPPLGSHVFQANVTIFELIQDIIKTNLLTKVHEDWTINVASRE
ncbi:hypothetical protein DPMN_080730 [Dreissena polymorpha]|uniref:Uncharacterized protein n=1 Tax=Dreissena polymorpha TaxID=45954 RepID=A0A9D3YUE3_DREPO|nr:hypothetical protein DPMN_080730 [Dreissena polymorpha]